ncbi:MAG: PEGA domain-containing protein [Gammaproteobacteria bacterium]|nr:PEGA domain-containing protein [Gammaproteobacteria bacterium]
MTTKGDKEAGFSELFLVLDDSGRIGIVSSAPADEKALLARFSVTAGQVQVNVDSAAVPVFRNGAKLTKAVVLKNGDRLRAGDMVLNFAADGRGGVLYQQATDENATHPPGSNEAQEEKIWLLLANAGDEGIGDEIRLPAADDTGKKISPGQYVKSADTAVRKKRIAVLPLVIAGVFVLLGLVAGFMFSATAVRVVVDPAPDSIEVDGEWVSLELGGRYLLLPGEARISIKKSEYFAIQETFQVERRANQEVTFQLTRLPDLFEILSEPDASASVQVDGIPIGRTPLTELALHPGDHELLVTADRFLDHRETVQVDGGGNRKVITVNLEPAWANVELITTPADARVSVDDKEIGNTPLSVEMLQGSRQLKISKAGFKTWQENVRIVAGEHQRIPVTLAKSDGKVVIRTEPPGASVTINSRYRGRTPLNIALAPDKEYRLSFSLSGYAKAARSISVRSDQDASVLVNLRALLGMVDIRSEPAGATIKIDGTDRGQTNLQLQLSALPHLVEFSKPGYAPYYARVTPRPGFEQQLIARLKTLEQERWDAIPTTIKTGLGQPLKLVRGGNVNMGAPRRQKGRRANEIQHPVKLTRAYYLGTHEVTNADYRRFQPEHKSGAVKTTSLNQGTHPVVQISWQDAAKFCNWLSEKDGLPAAYIKKDNKMVAVSPMNTGYRLPSEAEWAFMQRLSNDGDRIMYPWGDALPPKDGSGNFADVSARSVLSAVIATYDDKYLATAPVGHFDANVAGFYDLAGNVAEWAHDNYSADPLVVGQLTVDPLGPASGEYHVVRGSSWTSASISELRVGYRDYGSDSRHDLGFRLARYLE